MDQKQIFKQIVEFNQASFNNAFSVVTLLQDQFEKTSTAVMDQVIELPVSAREAVENWAEVFKESRNNIKKQVDENFEQAMKPLSGS